MHWAALLTDLTDYRHTPPSTERPQEVQAALAGIAVWALQFTPKVCIADDAVLLEVEASFRLHGGQDVLHALVETGATELGVVRTAWAPTSLAALALARAGLSDGFSLGLQQVLDPLPYDTLTAVRPHSGTLARLGCRTLANIRALPRGGLNRRFDQALLLALDQAYGLRPEVHRWVQLPEVFDQRLELPGRVETASALLFGARRLLLQLGGWLAARHCGVTAFALYWCHDVMRSRHVGDGGDITVRTAQPTQNVDHLSRLLSEHLAKVELLAPVGDLRLVAIEVVPITEATRSLLPDDVRTHESITHVLERVAIRLGAKRVLRPHLVEDHRMEWMQRWQPHDVKVNDARTQGVQVPQPSWVLRNPMKLAVVKNCPMYQGPLQLLLGPERVSGGWWHRVSGQADTVEPSRHLHVHRDYWVAASEHAGVLWVFQQRGVEGMDWYLHGHFA